eukprot:scaffold306817_cov67-Attheya_sp.AAC.6
MRFDGIVGIKESMVSKSASCGQSEDKFCPAFGSRSMISSSKPVWIVNIRGLITPGSSNCICRREEIAESSLDDSMALRHGGGRRS